MPGLPTQVSSLNITVMLDENPKLRAFRLDTPVSKSGAFTYDYDPITGKSRHHNGSAIDPLTEQLAQALFKTEGVGCFKVVTLGFQQDTIWVDKSPDISDKKFFANVIETIGKVYGIPKNRVSWLVL